MRWPAPSLFRRLLAVLLAAVLLLWLFVAGLAVSALYVADSGALDQDLKLIASAVAQFSALDTRPEFAVRVGELVRRLNQQSSDPPIQPEEFVFQVWTREGRLLAHSENRAPLRPLPPGSLGSTHRTSVDGWSVIAQRSDDGRVIAVVGYAEAFYARVRRTLFMELFRPLVIVSLFFAAALWIAARVGLRPLQRLAEQIGQRPAEDVSEIRVEKNYSELAPLTTALNRKIHDLNELRARERELFADAAHELRTPLAAISAQAHVLANETNPLRRPEALRALELGVARASATVDKLITLARLEHGVRCLKVERADLGALAEEAVLEHRSRAEAGDRRLELHLTERSSAEAPHIQGDFALLRIALENVIDNALKYSPPGSTVQVAVHAREKVVRLEVADDGPGIAPELRDRAFERFARLNSPDIEGSGLGLAIVRRIVELHGGSVDLAPANADVAGRATGCRVTMEFPRQS